jgi:hypothetical protein
MGTAYADHEAKRIPNKLDGAKEHNINYWHALITKEKIRSCGSQEAEHNNSNVTN